MEAKAESATLLNNCTLSEISNMCLNFHLHQIASDSLIDNINTYINNASSTNWINANLRGGDLHCSATEPILETFKCKLTQGTYECAVTGDNWHFTGIDHSAGHGTYRSR